MSEVRVRPAVEGEYGVIGELTVAAYERSGQLSAESNGYRDELIDVAGHAREGDVLVAVQPDGEVVGSVLFVLPGSAYAELAAPGDAEFRMLAVAPGAQRRGVGEALVRACVDRARSVGARAIVISARDFIEAPQRLYGRLGFVRTPERDWSPVPGLVSLIALRLELADQV